MTVIAVRGNVMAADSKAVNADVPHRCEKIWRVRGKLIGAAGETAACLAYLRHFRGERVDLEELKGASALVLCPRRGMLLFEETTEPDPVLEEFFAIGSGADAALGAMQFGASAIESVEAACRWNVNCGLPVVSLTIPSRRRRAA